MRSTDDIDELNKRLTCLGYGANSTQALRESKEQASIAWSLLHRYVRACTRMSPDTGPKALDHFVLL